MIDFHLSESLSEDLHELSGGLDHDGGLCQLDVRQFSQLCASHLLIEAQGPECGARDGIVWSDASPSSGTVSRVLTPLEMGLG